MMVSEGSKKKGYILKNTTQEIEKFSNVFADAFVNEPLLQALGASRDPLYAFGKEMFQYEAENDNGLTIVAKCDDEIVGFCLNEDGAIKRSAEDVPEPYLDLPDVAFSALSQSNFLQDRGYDIDQFGLVVHLFVIAVAPHMGGQGIGGKLAAETIKVAKEEGYKFVRIECSGAYSAKLCNFVSERQIDYQTSFNDEDKKKIQLDKLGPHKCIDLMWYEIK
eukprot:TRINITY_DN2173_c0_g1_i4.p2 TRINITY_DN2173_c0_g1~~TRINITY_DN2173_c0_g1_i4.p2  ORF type:complete len:220 (+),score=40.12 TRINITY_DN2173_c0_g1_i4:182-841(+)